MEFTAYIKTLDFNVNKYDIDSDLISIKSVDAFEKITYFNCFEKKNTISRIYNQTKKFFTDKKFQKKFYDIKKNYK
jgi:hypothetical protein